LKKQYSSHITMARICPYCQNKLEILCKGNHGAVYVKCPHCGEQVFFPPVAFRLNRF
jgi:DNA-directed RNA polymerase subunit RPC12/RpoP